MIDKIMMKNTTTTNTTAISLKPVNTSLLDKYSKDSEEIPSKHFYQYGTKKIEYFVVRTKRRKTSEIIVDSDEIVFRVPYSKPLKEIEKILNEKIRWILDKQIEIIQNEKKIEIVKPDYSENTKLPYLGKNYDIEIRIIDSFKESKEQSISEENKTMIEFQNNRFLYTLDNSDNQVKKIKSLYEKWLYRQAQIIFKEKVDTFSNLIDVKKPDRIVIKNLKNRWGSLSKNNTINLNVNLIKAPEDVINYVIIHELCHFKIKGHSYKFWKYLGKYVSNYESKVNWLSINGSIILI